MWNSTAQPGRSRERRRSQNLHGRVRERVIVDSAGASALPLWALLVVLATFIGVALPVCLKSRGDDVNIPVLLLIMAVLLLLELLLYRPIRLGLFPLFQTLAHIPIRDIVDSVSASLRQLMDSGGILLLLPIFLFGLVVFIVVGVLIILVQILTLLVAVIFVVHIIPTVFIPLLARWVCYPLVFSIAVASTRHPVEESLPREPWERADAAEITPNMYDADAEGLPSAWSSRLKKARIDWLTERVKSETSFMEEVRRYMKERARRNDS